MMNKLIPAELVQIKNELNETVDIVIYVLSENYNRCCIFIINNDYNLCIFDIISNLKTRFKFETFTYCDNNHLKYYILTVDQNICLNYNCLITEEHKIIDGDIFLKNISMREFIKKFNTDILINIEPCIDIIFMDYKAIKFNRFFTIIKYASAGLFDVNEHNVSIYFKRHK